MRVLALSLVLLLSAACIRTGGERESAAPVPTFRDNIEEAFAEAGKTGKPLLIDFYGIWCPPCLELEETVFESAPFLEKSKSFVLLRVDADAESSWQIKDRYKIGGYPTILFTNPSGEEIYRVVGYRPPGEFLKVMELVLSAKDRNLAQSCESGQAEDLYRCAVICGERGDKPCALKAYGKLLKQVPPGSQRHLEARTYLVRQSENEDLKRQGYEKLMEEFPGHPWALVWASEYLALGGEGKGRVRKDVLEKVAAQVSGAEKSPDLAEMGLGPADILGLGAELMARLDKEAQAKALWLEAAGRLEQLGRQMQEGAAARAFALQRIHFLEAGGKREEALKLAREYRLKFADQFTFHFEEASLLHRANRYQEAIPIARKALELSYGDNRIRSAILLVRLLGTIPDKAGAQQVRDQVRGSIKPDATLQVRTHRYLQELDNAYLKIVLASVQQGQQGQK